jgi:D-sedoheptulose 7-phosphate isomerase
LQVGRVIGLRCLGLTGASGGAMRGLCDVTICAPGRTVAEVQERHLPIYHAICSVLEETFFSVHEVEGRKYVPAHLS